MAEIGYLGDVVFQVSDRTVLTLSNWKWSGAARYAVHSRHNADALTEFTGNDPDMISFDVLLHAGLGVDPMAQLQTLWQYKRAGTAVRLTVGTHFYGRYRWNITNLSISIQHTNHAGNLSVVVVTIQLQEYLQR